MILRRQVFSPNGIFGTLFDDLSTPLAFTLEHAYGVGDGSWLPKVPKGFYNCKRGLHRLAGHPDPFETFEVLVPGHTGILFHVGNYNDDSEGCILLGTSTNKDYISGSLAAFDEFMGRLKGIDSFQIEVC